MTRRRAGLLGCAVLALVALVVISRAVNLRVVRFTSRTGGSAKAVKVRLDYVCWGDVTEEALNRHWMAEFEKRHPGTSVNIITTTGGEGTEIKIQTMIAGGAPPDVMYVWPEVFPTFVRKEVYLPLDEMMAQDGVDRADWFDVLIDFYTAQGHVYGLPRSWHPYVLFYNKDMFDQAGVPYPQPGWTWDDVIRHGLKLTRDVDGDGNVDQYAIANVPWEIFVWGHGGETYDEKGRCLLDSPEAIAGLELYRDLIWKYKIMPPPQHLTQSLNAQEMFKTGRLGMFGLGIWCVPDFREIGDFTWDIGPMPAGPAQRITKLVTAGWAIYSDTAHPQQSWELVKYLSGPEAQTYQMRIWRDPSGIRQVFENMMFWEPEEPPASRQVVLDSIDFGRFAPTFEGWAEVEQKARLVREELETGREEDVRRIVREIERVSREVLDDYRRREREAGVAASTQ
jgi:multiple sugar transport system substrate-binding protein